ncbi:MAG TPA: CHAT domain-containing tetratricopeptide repeat protein [Thermoanaerobaculia bacterium]|jgi:CHAT domain-containing protein/tetratricopeptide (TPR) repeat protein|nr:CHAT domain-containing tetratricopeptide repeat protein [Thermoanaerobaculia bacterium]
MAIANWRESFRFKSMPPEKRTGLLLALLTVGAGLLFLSIPSPPKLPERQVTNLKLPAGRGGSLQGEMIHAFRFRLHKDEAFAATLIDSRDDVTVRLLDPSGTEVSRVNSANGLHDSEILHALAERDGDYVLEAQSSADVGMASHYRLEFGPPHPAGDRDRRRAAAMSWFSRGERFFDQESWEQAIESYRKALSAWTESRDAERASATRFRLGRGLLALEQPKPAEILLAEALKEVRARQSPIAEARLSDGIGRCRLQRGELVEAQEWFQQALGIYCKERFRPGEADLLANLGVVARQQGDFRSAGMLDFGALEIRESLGGLRNLSTLYQNLGELYLAQQQAKQTLEFFDKALAAGAKAGSLKDQAAALRGKGTAHWQLGQVDKALSTLGDSIDLWRALGDVQGEVFTLIRLGDVYDRARRLSKARWIYLRALRLAQDSRYPRIEAMAMGNLGHVLGQQGKKEGLDYFERAEAAFVELGDSTPLAKLAFGKAEIYRNLGDPDDLHKARLAVEEAIRGFEAFQSPARRIAAAPDRRASYELYVDVLMRLGEPARAFEAAEASRFRTLLDDIKKSRTGKQLAQKRVSDLENRLNALEAERYRLPKNSTRIEEIDREVLALDARLALARSELNPQQDPPEPLTLEEVQQSLEPDALLLVYFLGEDRSFLWEIGRNQFQTHEIPVRRSDIEDAAKKVHEELSEGTPQEWRKWTKALKTMSDLVLSPVADRLQDHKLIIDPDGALNLVPFAALLDPRTLERKGRPGNGSERPRFLVFDHEIVTVPSVSLVIARREALKGRPTAPKTVAVLANPVYPRGSGFSPLPKTVEEARAILAMVPPDQSFIALGHQANRAVATSPEMGRYRILHFAAHGWNRDRPDLSGVVLSLVDKSGRKQDGFLRAFEIYELNLSADLVVLSACKTGIGEGGTEEGGLVRAFLNAGARQVMATLWSVQDDSTARLMESFYRSHLTQGLSTSAALHQAQLSFLKRSPTSSPRHWAGFVLHGDWN